MGASMRPNRTRGTYARVRLHRNLRDSFQTFVGGHTLRVQISSHHLSGDDLLISQIGKYKAASMVYLLTDLCRGHDDVGTDEHGSHLDGANASNK